MVEKSLKVKTESLAKRCEICHQNDHFDAITNVCRRCKGINYKEIPKYVKSFALPFFLANLAKNPDITDNEYLNTIRWRKAAILFMFSSMLFLIIRVAGFIRDKQIREGIKRGDPEYQDLWCFYSYWGQYEVPMVLLSLFAFSSLFLAIFFIGFNLYKKFQSKRIL